MPAQEPDQTFKVTDRRRRADGGETPSTGMAEGPGEVSSPPPPEIPDEGESLTGLFGMLANSAAMALSEGDPDQGSELIEILVLLRKKTEGNRTAEETQVLDELIYELQVRYVEVMKPSG